MGTGLKLLVEYLPHVHAALDSALSTTRHGRTQGETGRSEVQGQIGLQRKFKASLVYGRDPVSKLNARRWKGVKE